MGDAPEPLRPPPHVTHESANCARRDAQAQSMEAEAEMQGGQEDTEKGEKPKSSRTQVGRPQNRLPGAAYRISPIGAGAKSTST